MRSLIHKIFGCNYSKPIASQYLSFNSRSIIYECKCGKRKLKRVWRNFDEPFPIQTNILITDKELYKILKP